ncbi:MAG: hypothetical protein AB7V62_09410 [Thermoleophilia bacterium]
MTTGDTERRERPPRPRRPPKRKIPAVLAAVLAVVALMLGIVVGYAARGDSPPSGLMTETRTVPVVTVTVPE